MATMAFAHAEATDEPEAAPVSRILLVEDDAAIAAQIDRFLTDSGMDVTRATEGAAGLALASTGTWDAIVLDRMLPGMDGMEVLRRLRAADVATPVLVLTARDSVGERVAGLEAGST